MRAANGTKHPCFLFFAQVGLAKNSVFVLFGLVWFWFGFGFVGGNI